MYKGVILAGGTGSRLFPATLMVSKQLLPIYDKPMIYYPLSVLMLAGIRDILIITTAQEQSLFMQLLGDGSQLGCRFSYAQQTAPNGIAEALLIAEPFLQGAPVCLVLGDNLFYGQHFGEMLQHAAAQTVGATIFAHHVQDPKRFGVIEFDDCGKALAITEKPESPRSAFAVTGLYFYDGQAVEFAKALRPSARGELEITDINNAYLARQSLQVQVLGRGFAWLDNGTPDTLLAAGQFVQTIEQRQGLKIACIEEIAFNQGWICAEQLSVLAARYSKNQYGRYLERLLQEPYLHASQRN